MKKLLVVLLVLGIYQISAQEFKFKKGVVTDAIKMSELDSDTFSLFLPSSFNTTQSWPILFIFDFNGREKQVMRLFAKVAEEKGFILAASNNLKDTVSLSKNAVAFGKLYNSITNLLPIKKEQIYTVGYKSAGRIAVTMPAFINDISGVISYGSSVVNLDMLNPRKPFQYIGIVGKENFMYAEMLVDKKTLNALKFPNSLLVFDENKKETEDNVIRKALTILSLSAMAKGSITVDDNYINESFKQSNKEIQQLISSNKLLKAEQLIGQSILIYKPFKSVDSLKIKRRSVKKNKIYKSLKRAMSNVIFKEKLLKDDYNYYLEEDIAAHNFNNLGWWVYQTGEIVKFKNSPNEEIKFMGHRLNNYVEALIEDSLDIELSAKNIDNDALSLLWMLQTIVTPKAYDAYLKIISHSSKNNDNGTAVFYLEELLKNGYTDVDKLYDLEFTALLKISPEYNTVIEKYLKKARYLITE